VFGFCEQIFAKLEQHERGNVCYSIGIVRKIFRQVGTILFVNEIFLNNSIEIRISIQEIGIQILLHFQ
jgi:hypothetical protein